MFRPAPSTTIVDPASACSAQGGFAALGQPRVDSTHQRTNQILEAVVRATGDASLAAAVRVRASAGADALLPRPGKPILTDSRMVRAGIDRLPAARLGAPILCVEERFARTFAADRLHGESDGAVGRLASLIDGALVVCGSDPSALRAVLRVADAGGAMPAVVIGMPTGAAAVTVKAQLHEYAVTSIVIEGTRGGPAAAAAVANVLLRSAQDAVPHPPAPAVLFVGHGSRVPGAGTGMEALIQAVGVRGGFAILEHAYLSLEAPSIPEGVRRCVERGAGRIVVVPYFLHVGRHMVRDLPGILRAEQAKYPHVPIVLGRHLGQHEALVEIMLDRIIEAVSAPDAEALHGTDDAGFLIQVAPRDTASASTSSSGPSRSWSAWPPHTHSHQHGAWSSDRSS